jgi:hypothetical protein
MQKTSSEKKIKSVMTTEAVAAASATTTTKRPKTFVLKISDPADIDQKYNFHTDFNLDRKDPPKNCTRIDRMNPMIPIHTEPSIDFSNNNTNYPSSSVSPPFSSNIGLTTLAPQLLLSSSLVGTNVDVTTSSTISGGGGGGHGKTVMTSISSSIESSTIKVLHNNLKKAPFSITVGEIMGKHGVNGEEDLGLEGATHIPRDIHSKLMKIQELEPWCTNVKLRDNLKLTFMDECKKEHQCVTTMLSSMKNDTLSEHTILHCFWCRHPFPHRPIGVPIFYIPHRVHKQYYSEITNDTYILRENINQVVEDEPLTAVPNPNKPNHAKKSKIILQPRDYYVSDGSFCSFNCALAFIREQRSNPLYTESEALLLKLYHETYGYEVSKLQASPSWRLLRNYGGHLTIEDFRRNLFKIDYRPMGNIVLPTFRPIGFLFERQVKI